MLNIFSNISANPFPKILVKRLALVMPVLDSLKQNVRIGTFFASWKKLLFVKSIKKCGYYHRYYGISFLSGKNILTSLNL